MSDMALTAVAKIYAGLSARRFDSDVRDATAKGLTDQDPHFNSVLRYLPFRQSDARSSRDWWNCPRYPLKGVERVTFAADSTGFTTCRFVRWYDEKWGLEEKSKQSEWVKLHAMTGVRTNIVTAVEMSQLNQRAGTVPLPAVHAPC